MRISSLAAVLAAIAIASGPAAAEAPWSFDLSWGEPPARIGVEVQPMTPELRRFFRVPGDQGVLVVRVDADGPAGKAGVQVGDVIVAAGGDSVSRSKDLRRAVLDSAPGASLELQLRRDGEETSVNVEPIARAKPSTPPFEPFAERSQRALEQRLEQLEQRLRELERTLRRELDLRLGPQGET